MNGKSVQGFLDFTLPVRVPLANIDTRGWRRVSIVTERCTGKCSSCTCVSDLQILARDAAMGEISFGSSGSPLLSPKQIRILRSKREKSVLDESTDSIFLSVDVAPAPLSVCNDDEL